jgi:hypothetical protein
VVRVHLDVALGDLLLELLVRAEEELLPGLAAGVEGAAHLRAAERAVGEEPAVLARERHALRVIWSMMFTDTSARRYTFASRARKSPPLIVS